MNILKPLSWLLIASVVYLSGALQYVASLAQTVVLQSGFVNAEVVSNSKTSFDYNFSVKDLSGSKKDFKEFYGKVIFLNLWAMWCGPCRGEMASIQKLYDEVDKDKVAFVMLSL